MGERREISGTDEGDGAEDTFDMCREGQGSHPMGREGA